MAGESHATTRPSTPTLPDPQPTRIPKLNPATKVVSVIDPDGAYFSKRVVSRDDCPDLGSSKSLG